MERSPSGLAKDADGGDPAQHDELLLGHSSMREGRGVGAGFGAPQGDDDRCRCLPYRSLLQRGHLGMRDER